MSSGLPVQTAELHNITVLLVEPDRDSRELYAMSLEAAGAIADAVGDRVEAIDRLQAYTPDCVVTELGLPRLSGSELCRRIVRAYGRRVPVLVVTALSGAY